MKIGKEGIVGAIAALRRWQQLDHEAVCAARQKVINHYVSGLEHVPGLRSAVHPDPTGNPILRVRVHVEREVAELTAGEVADELKRHSPPIHVRDDEIDLGYFELDPCNVSEAESKVVARAIAEILQLDQAGKQAIRERHRHPANLADELARGLDRIRPKSNTM
jgi:L-seryl-tRNA(Ser) seleniumtransferase